MSAYDQTFCNPSLDANNPVGGPILTNASPDDLTVLVAVELTRDPQQPEARAVLRGLASSEQAQEHVVAVAAPLTRARTTVVVRLAAMEDGKPRPMTLEVLTPGAVATVRILSATPAR